MDNQISGPLTIALITVTTLLITTQISRFHQHLTEHLNRATHHLKGTITMTAQDTINAVVTQLGKAKAELIGKIADLELQIADAGVADKVDLTELTAAAQALDDIVPDVALDNTGGTGD